MQGQRGRAQFPGGSKIVDPQHLGAGLMCLCPPRRKGLPDRTADDHADHFLVGEVGDLGGGDMLAVAQHREAIAKRAHLTHAV